MRISESWLRTLVDLEGISHQDLVDRLTMSGLEVDDSGPVAGSFESVMVARIDRCEPHPDADKLQLCQVDVGDGSRHQIVCGAPNARAGLIAPLAVVGATLPGDFKIKKAKLRGVESFGMLCSASELGLSEDASGLLELPSNAPVGTDLRDYLELNDSWIDIDLTPNRADCLSMVGIAQDVAAMFGRKATSIEVEPTPATRDTEKAIRLDAPADCARYVGRAIHGIDVSAKSPLWMTERLRRSGLKSIHPVVDVTNYVLLELGQPMHGFDLNKLSGAINVRRAAKGEQLTLLTDDEAELDERFLLICDESGPVALGGVMGGASTAVDDQTVDVFFEAAWFNPATIVGRARALGLTTDAAHRFERGVDPDLQVIAMEHATGLLIDIAGGEPGPIIESVSAGHLPERKPVKLRFDRIGKLLGTEIPRNRVQQILEDLGMHCVPDESGWTVTAPTRRFDIELEEDLIEEVIRVYGYDKLQGRAPEGAIPAVSIEEARFTPTAARHVLAERGYREAITYSFIPETQITPLGLESLALQNPLSQELAQMRPALAPGLLAAAAANQKRQQDRVRLFEYGVAFPTASGATTEVTRLCAIAFGPAAAEQWGTPDRALDFFDVKGDLEALLYAARQNAKYTPSEHSWLHPGQSADILIAERSVGWIGALHPSWLKSAGVKGTVIGFEIDFSALSPVPMPAIANLSRYPSTRRDLAFMVPETVRWEQIRDIVEETAGNLLTKLVVFDEYRGSGMAEGKKSMGFGLTLGMNDRTLTDEEADAVTERVTLAIGDELAGELRG